MSRVLPDRAEHQRPQPPAATRPYTVQLEDGSIETFQIDTRVAPETLPGLLEGAVRARTRQKQGQAAPVPPQVPNAFPSTMGANIIGGLKGLAEIPAGMARNFIEGAQFVNKDPMGAVGLMPEAVMGPARNAVESFGKFREGGGRLPFESSNQVGVTPGQAADLVNAVPIVGPMATETGERMAAGEGPEAIGNLTGQAVLGTLGAKYGGQAISRAASAVGKKVGMGPAAAAPAPTLTQPTVTAPRATVVQDTAASMMPDSMKGRKYGHEMGAARLNTIDSGIGLGGEAGAGAGGISAESVAALREALAKAPPAKAPAGSSVTPAALPDQPVTIRLPLRIGLGRVSTPISIEISGARIASAKAFLNTVRGSAAETMWANRLLEGLVPDDDKEGDSRGPTGPRNILGFDD